MPDILPSLAEIDERVAVARENLRELVEQPPHTLVLQMRN